MTWGDREILLRDLCARLPYNVICEVPLYDEPMILTGRRLNYFCFHEKSFLNCYMHEHEVVVDPYNSDYVVRPYLRPVSDMTEEEAEEYNGLHQDIWDKLKDCKCADLLDWLNAHHFDYRGLIGRGLAIEASYGMYYPSGE